jgi:hypothetical protein
MLNISGQSKIVDPYHGFAKAPENFRGFLNAFKDTKALSNDDRLLLSQINNG